MYYSLALVSGILISIMIVFNGNLSTNYGLYISTVIIHFTGLLLITLIILLKKEKSILKKQPFYLYLGGVIGVGTIVFNNFCFGKISISAIIAISLLGQSISGLIIDQFGLLGMEQRKFEKSKSIGLIIILIGIAYMITDFVIVPVILSFLTGICIVLARTANAHLAVKTSLHTSTFYNYVTGTITSIIVLLLLGSNELFSFNFTITPPYTMYTGGLIGVAIVLLFNLVVKKISSFYMTLFTFIGQLFSSLLIDAILSKGLVIENLVGGIIVTIGSIINLYIDYKQSKL